MQILFSVLVPLVFAQHEGRVRTIEPFVDAATVAVARADLSRLDLDALAKELGAFAPDQFRELVELQAAFRQWVGRFKQAGAKEVYGVVSLADLPGTPVFLVAPLEAGADAKALAAALAGSAGPLEAAEQFGTAVVAGKKTTLERLRKLKPAARPELAQAFAAAGDATAQLLLLPPAHARRLLEETYPTLPRELGGGPATALTRGFLWAAATVATQPQLELRLVIQSQDAKAAQVLAELRRSVVNALLEASVRGDLSLKLAALADPFKPKVVGDRLLVSLDAAQVRAVLAPAVQRALAEAERTGRGNNLKMLGLALHNHHDATGAFPAVASHDKQAKPLLSWRVHILPYVEQEALYREFRLDEPWDSAHNKQLIGKMPAIFRGPTSKAAQGMTTLVAPVSPTAIFAGGPKGVQVNDITDGTSNTILLIDVDDAHAVPWTKPDDWKLDAAQPHKGLREHANGVYAALFADGLVHFLPKDLDAKTLWALFTRAGGEVVNVP